MKSLDDKPLDFFGTEIDEGSHVIGGSGHELQVYKVKHITPKMVRVVRINAKTDKAKKGILRYSKELVIINNAQLTFYLMRNK